MPDPRSIPEELTTSTSLKSSKITKLKIVSSNLGLDEIFNLLSAFPVLTALDIDCYVPHRSLEVFIKENLRTLADNLSLRNFKFLTLCAAVKNDYYGDIYGVDSFEDLRQSLLESLGHLISVLPRLNALRLKTLFKTRDQVKNILYQCSHLEHLSIANYKTVVHFNLIDFASLLPSLRRLEVDRCELTTQSISQLLASSPKLELCHFPNYYTPVSTDEGAIDVKELYFVFLGHSSTEAYNYQFQSILNAI